VLENLEAKQEVEGVVVERQLVEARLAHRDLWKPASGELDGLLADVHRRHAIRKQCAEPRQSLALTASGIEYGLGAQHPDDCAQPDVEAVDQTANDRVAGLELGVVAALRQDDAVRS
jgi:hypothetical protein